MNSTLILIQCGLAILVLSYCSGAIWDESGYVFYCPCMGRFGNQAEHFLGSLGFAKSTNRTLILPPWRTYRNVAFNEFFDVETVQKYHRALLAEDFLKELAPDNWPVGHRVGWCFHYTSDGPTTSGCDMKKGSPSTPFWDGLNVNFDSQRFYNTSYVQTEKWKRRFPGNEYPVLAFRGAPARFPILEQHHDLQKYLKWSSSIDELAEEYINLNFPNEKYIGLHFRNGMDWVRACNLKSDVKSFMSSYQCYGFNNTRTVDANVCLPTTDTVLSQLEHTVEETNIKVIYISTDNNPMKKEIEDYLQHHNVQVFYHDSTALPQINLAILQRSNHFIGSCMSSFSAFVSRHRKVHNLPSTFWGYFKPISPHSEL